MKPSTRRILSLVSATALICTATACSVTTSRTSSSSETSTVSVETDRPVSMQVDAAKVTLVDAGEGARQQLSYWSPEGDDTLEQSESDAKLTVRSKLAQDVKHGQVQDTPDAPDFSSTDTSTVTLGMQEQVHAADTADTEEGATRSVGLKVADANSDVAATGFHTEWQQKPNGQILSVTMSAPAQASDDSRSATEKAIMRALSLPVVFPDEPVGKGARWTVESRVTGESSLLQTATYTLIDAPATDAPVRLKVDVSQRPTISSLDLGQALEGVDGNLDVLSSKTSGGGQITVDPRAGLPSGGEVNYTTRVVYGQMDKDVRVIQDASTGLRFGQ